jgi:S1-C subfamily serine protease/DNA-directed RNA polymerase subunit RPC12/RpoP
MGLMPEVLCRCSGCSAKFKVDSKYAGRKARCPKCSQIVEVPKADAPKDGAAPVSTGTTVVPSATATVAIKPSSHSSTAKVAPPVSRASAVVPAPRPSIPVPPPAEPPVAPPPVAETYVSDSFESPPPTEPLPPAPSPVAAPDTGFGFQLNTSNTGSRAASSAAVTSAKSSAGIKPAGAKPAGKKPNSQSLLLAMAAVVALLLVGGGIFAYVMVNRGSPAVAKNGKSSAASKVQDNTGKLVLDWPEEDRTGGFSVRIDGEAQPAVRKGELYYNLSPGDHQMILQRRGYSQIDATISVTKAEVTTYKPEWKKTEFGSSSPVLAARPESGGTPFEIGTATGNPVPGFEGFSQNFFQAEEAARRSQRSLLIVFGISDVDPQTRAIGAATQQAETKALVAEKYHPVMLDFPRTRERYENLYDNAQNGPLREEFAILEMPALVICDARGKTYYVQTKWDKGTSDLRPYLAEAEAARAERDRLLADVQGESLDPAVKAVEWLLKNKLAPRYEEEIESWLRVAQRLDADNAKGQLESFVEADMVVKLVELDADDDFGVTQFARNLETWLSDKKFQNPDRAVRLHLLVARLLHNTEHREDSRKHVERAETYTPNDPKVRESLKYAKQVIERGSILSSGTGFLVSSEGHILTNHHVIEGEGKTVVRIPKVKDPLEATIIAKDEERDMALIKIDLPAGETFAPVPISPGAIGRGLDIAAFGYPLGDQLGSGLKLTTGSVMALPDDSNKNMITLDLRVNPGNSGGPLCDQKGNVVGMVTAKTGGNIFAGVDSYGLAVPAEYLVAFLDKHLPAETKRPTAKDGDKLSGWAEVDGVVSPAVLMILKVE